MTHYLAMYAKLNSVEELNTEVRQHVEIHWNTLSKTDRRMLEMIRCESVKHLAAHMTHQQMQEKLNVSNTTVRRTIRKLEKLKIIERIIYTQCVTVGLGPNVYVVLPVDRQEIS